MNGETSNNKTVFFTDVKIIYLGTYKNECVREREGFA